MWSKTTCSTWAAYILRTMEDNAPLPILRYFRYNLLSYSVEQQSPPIRCQVHPVARCHGLTWHPKPIFVRDFRPLAVGHVHLRKWFWLVHISIRGINFQEFVNDFDKCSRLESDHLQKIHLIAPHLRLVNWMPPNNAKLLIHKLRVKSVSKCSYEVDQSRIPASSRHGPRTALQAYSISSYSQVAMSNSQRKNLRVRRKQKRTHEPGLCPFCMLLT
jgi:hypothetical protein